jgi:hypothetical protein
LRVCSNSLDQTLELRTRQALDQVRFIHEFGAPFGVALELVALAASTKRRPRVEQKQLVCVAVLVDFCASQSP